jgi:hypothetical protein
MGFPVRNLVFNDLEIFPRLTDFLFQEAGDSGEE